MRQSPRRLSDVDEQEEEHKLELIHVEQLRVKT